MDDEVAQPAQDGDAAAPERCGGGEAVSWSRMTGGNQAGLPWVLPSPGQPVRPVLMRHAAFAGRFVSVAQSFQAPEREGPNPSHRWRGWSESTRVVHLESGGRGCRPHLSGPGANSLHSSRLPPSNPDPPWSASDRRSAGAGLATRSEGREGKAEKGLVHQMLLSVRMVPAPAMSLLSPPNKPSLQSGKQAQTVNSPANLLQVAREQVVGTEEAPLLEAEGLSCCPCSPGSPRGGG